MRTGDIIATRGTSLTLASELVRRRYDRIARIYDTGEALMELRARAWRRAAWAAVAGAHDILEVGVGTGKSIPFYPPAARVTALDISPRMLDRARQRARRAGRSVALDLADAQAMPYAAGAFDAVVSIFVFCSVPDPIQALAEVKRVLRPGGRLIMVEHVLSRRRILRAFLCALDPWTERLWGAHVARQTDETVRAAGFATVAVTDLALDVVKRIDAALP